MATYNVLLLLHATDAGELVDRLHTWDLTESEHVLSITAVPEPVEIPPGLAAPAGGSPPLTPKVPTPLPPPVTAPTDG